MGVELGRLTAIFGAMHSGKTKRFLSEFDSFPYAKLKFRLFQSSINVRDGGVIASYDGKLVQSATVIDSLQEVPVLSGGCKAIGIDEIQFFNPSEVSALRVVLDHGINIVVAGLLTDYRGELFPMSKALIERLPPDEQIIVRGVCMKCARINSACFNQRFVSGEVVTVKELGAIAVEGGSCVTYEPRCVRCFIFPND